MVSTSTRGGSAAPAVTARVASIPSSRGIRTSISTTSGRERPHSVDRGSTVVGLADHLDVGLGRQDHPQPGPDQRLVVDEDHPDRRVAHASSSV